MTVSRLLSAIGQLLLAAAGVIARPVGGSGASRDSQLGGSGAPSARLRPAPSRAARMFGAVTVTTVLLLAVGSSGASAAVIHSFLSSFGGPTAGSFDPQGLAVDNGSSSPSAGDVYAFDSSNGVVDKFSGSGSYLCQITGATGASVSASECDSSTAGTASGSLPPTVGDPAVDSSSGVFYLPDGEGVDAFSPTGGYAAASSFAVPGAEPFGLRGVAVGSSTGDVYVTDDQNTVVDVFNPATSSLSTFASSDPNGAFGSVNDVAVDNDPSSASFGDVYASVGSGGQSVVDVFGPSGNWLRSITGTPAGPFCGAGGLVVDPTTGHLYVVDPCFNASAGAVDEFDASGSYIGSLLGTSTSAGSWSPEDVAVSAGSGDVYVSDPSHGVVDMFGPEVTLPDVTTGLASNVAGSSATLNGTVNPEGTTITDCHFAYGTDTSYSAGSVPCATTPSGSTPQPVSADVSGLTPGQTDHFRLVAGNSSGASDGQDQFFGPPVVSLIGSNSLTTSGATVTASVNPQNLDTTYRFEYGTTTGYGASVPVPDADIGLGASGVQVSQTLTGLQPGTTYHFRVVATNADDVTDSPDETLTTNPAVVIDVQPPTGMSNPAGLATGNATLNAYLDPQGQDTTYHFEYGTGTGYGNSTATADAGSGAAPALASAQVTGLAADTTYHYRTVASNSLGTVDGPDGTFTTPPSSCPNQPFRTGLSANLPDCRAFEQVSPENKAGYGTTAPEVADVGDRVAFASLGSFAGASSDSGFNYYLGSRGSSGWSSTPITPPAADGINLPAAIQTGTPDLTEFAGALSAPAGAVSPKSATVYTASATGTFTAVTPPLTANDGGNLDGRPEVRGGSADLSTLVFEANIGLSASDPLNPFIPRLYEVTGANGPSPSMSEVTVNPDGTPMNLCGGGAVLGSGGSAHNPVSADGSAIFFAAYAASCSNVSNVYQSLYARVGGSRTVEVSDPSPNDECTTSACKSAQPEGGSFTGAAADGSKVYFTSDQQLTDSAGEDSQIGDQSQACRSNTGPNGCNLYEYDFGRAAGHNLVDVSAGDMSGLGPQVQGVAAVSDDGSKVYFVASGVLTSQPNSLGQTASAGAQNLYAYDAGTGTTRFIAQVPDDITNGSFVLAADTTPDGNHLVFSTNAQLTPDDQNQAVDVYEYDFATGGLWRVSVGHDGQDQNGNGGGDAIAAPFNPADFFRVTHVVSADGQDIVFTTARPLQNGVQPGATNAYEWHDGEVSLVSGGAPSNPVDAAGIDPSGQNITFETDQGLVPSDTDGLADVYDARIGGGFPAPAATPPFCSGDTCQGSPAGAPPVPTAATVTFAGPGNESSGPGGSPAKARVLTRTVRGDAFMVAVRVPAAGQITITGNRIAGAGGRARRAGTYRLRVSLTPAASRLLARGHSLKLSLEIAYAPTGGSSSTAAIHLTVLHAVNRRHKHGRNGRRPSHDRGGTR